MEAPAHQVSRHYNCLYQSGKTYPASYETPGSISEYDKDKKTGQKVSAFLGPDLWDETYDNTDISLEYMDLEEFLKENGIPNNPDNVNAANLNKFQSPNRQVISSGHNLQAFDSPQDTLPRTSQQAINSAPDTFPSNSQQAISSAPDTFPNDSPQTTPSPQNTFPNDIPQTTPSPQNMFPNDIPQTTPSPQNMFPNDIPQTTPSPQNMFPNDSTQATSMSPTTFPRQLPSHQPQLAVSQYDTMSSPPTSVTSSAAYSPVGSPAASPKSVDFSLSSDDLTLVNIEGLKDFDPRKRTFSEEELKPQPMFKKSRKIFVPDDNKDDRYWCRRNKNNVAAKRSRDARRIKENQIAMRAAFLEKENSVLRTELEQMKRENADILISLTEFETMEP